MWLGDRHAGGRPPESADVRYVLADEPTLGAEGYRLVVITGGVTATARTRFRTRIARHVTRLGQAGVAYRPLA